MKLDNTIKALLAIIAVFLGILVIQPVVAPSAHAAPGGAAKFANVTFSGVGEGFWLFNHDTGKVYSYLTPGPGTQGKYIGKINEVGNPIEL